MRTCSRGATETAVAIACNGTGRTAKTQREQKFEIQFPRSSEKAASSGFNRVATGPTDSHTGVEPSRQDDKDGDCGSWQAQARSSAPTSGRGRDRRNMGLVAATEELRLYYHS